MNFLCHEYDHKYEPYFYNQNYYNDQMLTKHQNEKENRSPSPTKHQQNKLNFKDAKSVQELITLLKNHGFVIPNFTSEKDCVFELKCSEDFQTQNFEKLKARLADRDFEVKKLEEDYAEFKLLSKLQNDKAMKKLREELALCKVKHGEEIKKWQIKFVEMTKKHELQCSEFRKITQNLFRGQKQEIVKTLTQKYTKQINQLHEQLAKNKQQYLQSLKKIKQDHEVELSKIKENHREEVEEVTVQAQQEIIKVQKIFENRVLAVQCEKKAEEKLVEQTKKQAIKKQEKFLAQIGTLERQRRGAVDKLDQVQMKVKVLTHRLQMQNIQMQKLKKEHEAELAAVHQELKQLQASIEDTIDKQRLKVLKQHYEKSQVFEKRILQLSQLKDTITTEASHNQKLLCMKFQRRESRKQDVEAIKHIETRLFAKERENSQLYEHLKMAHLERDNNDRIYTRIFTASKEKKNSSHRTDRDIYSLLKQSQTTDFRHMLKISQKQPKQRKK